MAEQVTSPIKAIREHCVACCGGYRSGINSPKGCNSPECHLFPFRFGRNPFHALATPKEQTSILAAANGDNPARQRNQQEGATDD